MWNIIEKVKTSSSKQALQKALQVNYTHCQAIISLQFSQIKNRVYRIDYDKKYSTNKSYYTVLMPQCSIDLTFQVLQNVTIIERTASTQ